MRQTALVALLAVGIGAALAQPVCAQDEEGDSADSGEMESRFRWGITGGGGPMVGSYSGFGLGVDARFGMQLSPLLGVYAQPVTLAAVGANADIDNAEVTAAALYGVGVLGDVTLADLFFVAAGPELLLGGVGSASQTVDPTTGTTMTVEAATGPFFSIAARAGFVFGTKKPDRRSGFSIGLDMHAVFAGDVVVLPLIFLGYERF